MTEVGCRGGMAGIGTLPLFVQQRSYLLPDGTMHTTANAGTAYDQLISSE